MPPVGYLALSQHAGARRSSRSVSTGKSSSAPRQSSSMYRLDAQTVTPSTSPQPLHIGEGRLRERIGYIVGILRVRATTYLIGYGAGQAAGGDSDCRDAGRAGPQAT